MFRWAVSLWTLLLLTAAGVILWSLTYLQEEDQQQLTLVHERMPVAQRHRSATEFYSQHREGVRRDTWQTRDAKRIHAVVYSDRADLEANQSDHETIETLHGVRCVIEEDANKLVGDPMVCTLFADNATYDYRRSQLVASPAELTRECPHNIGLGQWKLTCAALDYDLHQLHADGQVTLSSPEGFLLQCTHACLDQHAQTMQMDCAASDELVKLSGHFGADPIHLIGRTVDVQWDDSQSVRELVAAGEVELGYGGAWTAQGDRASYQSCGEGLNGIIVLDAEAPQGCTLTHLGGSCIQGQQVIVDTMAQQISLSQASGLLRSHRPTEPVELKFESDKALWDQRAQTLILAGNVCVAQAADRELKSQGEVRILCSSLRDGVRVSRLESHGPTQIVFGEGCEWLECQGTCLVDLESHRLVIHSPRGDNGRVAAEKQLVFRGPAGELTGDDLAITYEVERGQMVARDLVAEGHVCLARKTPTGAQYALSDVLCYQPVKEELHFRAVAPRRVLFFDRDYDIKVSAPQVRITRDPTTGKEVVKGLGDVRLTLLDQELARLRQRFAWEENE